MADFFFDTGVPDNGTGADGDVYLRTTNGAMYQKASGAWVLKFTPVNTTNGKKWSEAPNVTALNNSTYLMIIHAGVNKTITLPDFIQELLKQLPQFSASDEALAVVTDGAGASKFSDTPIAGT